MSSGEKPDVRRYKVILLERTTSPKVNRFIRDLTNVSNWEASSRMNSVPSTIVDGLSLHKSIEVKSQLARFGLRARVESSAGTDVTKEEEPETKEESQIPPGSEPKDAIVTEEAAKTVEDSPTPVKKEPSKPIPGGSPPRKKKRKSPLLVILLPFLIILIIIIIIIFYEPISDYFNFGYEGKITVYQDPGKLPKKLKFKKTAEEIFAQSRTSSDKPSDSFSLPPELPPHSGDGEPPSAEAGLSAPQGGEVEGSGSPSTPGLTPAPSGFGGPEGDVSVGKEGAQPKTLSTPASVSGGKALPGGLGQRLKVGSPPTAPQSAENLLDNAGFTPEKIETLIAGAQSALNQGDSAAAVIDFERLRLADALVKPDKNRIREAIDRPQNLPLMKKLAAAARRVNLKPGVEFYSELTGVRIRVHTNLPDSALVKVSLNIPGGDKPVEHVVPVMARMITIPGMDGLPSGVIVVKVVLMPLRKQPQSVLKAIGKKGELLTGQFVKGRGDIAFLDSLNNPWARSRGVITQAEAKSEFNRIASGQGIEDFEVHCGDSFRPDDLSIITIAADEVSDENFIMKACRSAGLLTSEMDEPPYYLRLIVNRRQYFIPTFVCRRLLREYRKDDPAGLDYLVNHLFTL